MFSSIISEESIANSFVLLFLQKKPTIPFTCLRVIQVSLIAAKSFLLLTWKNQEKKKTSK